MIIIIDLVAIFRTELIGTFMIYLHDISHSWLQWLRATSIEQTAKYTVAVASLSYFSFNKKKKMNMSWTFFEDLLPYIIKRR
jgi:hypothetical protein